MSEPKAGSVGGEGEEDMSETNPNKNTARMLIQRMLRGNLMIPITSSCVDVIEDKMFTELQIAQKRGEILGQIRLEKENAELKARLETAETENTEAYTTLVRMLKERFPVTAEGVHPDWAIEDVLEENASLKAQLADWNTKVRVDDEHV